MLHHTTPKHQDAANFYAVNGYMFNIMLGNWSNIDHVIDCAIKVARDHCLCNQDLNP